MAHSMHFEARYWMQMKLPGSGQVILPIGGPSFLYTYYSPKDINYRQRRYDVSLAE